jgi:DNA-binding PadR family transcriptional regulator
MGLLYFVEIMFDRVYLGEFEHLVLLALLRLDDRAYGVSVRQEIEIRAKREVSIGAVYATLDRLEAKGYVASSMGEPTSERGGRSKRFFRVTSQGMSALNQTQSALQRMTEGLNFAESVS